MMKQGTKTKDMIGKITDLFCIYFFKYTNLLTHINNFLSACQQNEKFTTYLQYNYVLIYIIYDGDGTIIAVLICDVRRRIRHLFITFAVVLDISSLLSLNLTAKLISICFQSVYSVLLLTRPTN
jgi:hypothetical protein